MSLSEARRVLVTRATGYVGGRLIHRLRDKGFTVRAMARRPSNLVDRVPEGTEIVHGDVSEPITLDAAMEDVDTAYYLVHSLASGGDFEQQEVSGARNFAAAAERAGIRRIVYLGGLGTHTGKSSAHMRSRHAVGEILREGAVPTVELQASIIIGPGSLSFELIRSLVRRLPVMIVPKWVRVKAQPIAIDDVLDYLVESSDVHAEKSVVYEIGGRDKLSYLDLMKQYGEMQGLSRLYINVPFLTPWLSSLWLNLVTPLFAKVGRKLIDSIRIASVVQDTKALDEFSVVPMDVEQTIARALDEEDRAFRETHWADAMSSTQPGGSYGGTQLGSRIVDSRVVEAQAGAAEAFAVIERIGGDTGWYYGDWLWQLRGFMDRLVGGVGMQRGRRDPNALRKGDIVDCWRVEALERPRRLLLRAEMKVFGRAWLQLEVTPKESGCEIRQTAVYDPRSLTGLVYWYSLFLLHHFVFTGMLRGIAKMADRDAVQGKYDPVRVNPEHTTLPPLD